MTMKTKLGQVKPSVGDSDRSSTFPQEHREDGYRVLWVARRDGVQPLYGVPDDTIVPGRTLDGPPTHIASTLDLRPILSTLPPGPTYDWACREHERIFTYWITCSDSRIGAVRAFVNASQHDTLPESWQQRVANDAQGVSHYVCTFSATLSQARSLGAQQKALQGLADLPGDVRFFQAIANIDGFSGIMKESRQPTRLAQSLYKPGDLFQTDVEEVAGQRGQTITDQDVLDATGLTLA